MIVKKTKLDGVLTIELESFIDFRGEYIETYNMPLYKKHDINVEFIQDDVSISSKHVLRGLHGDAETWKLISCLHGSFYLIVVNNDQNSSQYGHWESFTLSDKNRMQVLVPPKFGNGHLVLSDTAIFHYKQNTIYNPSGQFTICWNDPNFNFWWPIKNPITSRRDEIGRFLE